MAVWMVRAGRSGEREQFALDNNVAVIGWGELKNLSEVMTRDELYRFYEEAYPEAKQKTAINHVGQIWAFVNTIGQGDLVVLPLKTQSAIAIGKVKGPYQYRPEFPYDARHTRPLEWLRKDIPRSTFDQDLLYSLGAFMAVCRIQRNQAEERIAAILEDRPLRPITKPTEEESVVEQASINLEEYAQDEIVKYIGRKFAGHDLARLVTAILKAQGYETEMSSPGPDGGVDVMAGRGPLGFDPPRLCVQVKSGTQPLDVKTLREFQGVVRNFGANQGLLVSWGGFTQPAVGEARRLFFEIRLWDAGDLVRVLLEHYDRLPEDLQAELPLKRIWSLVLEE